MLRGLGPAMSVACLAALCGQGVLGQEPASLTAPVLTLSLDCSSGERVTNLRLDYCDLIVHPGSHDCLVFLQPGTATLRATFGLPAQPTAATLTLEHLSSSADVPLGGRSPVTLTLNGQIVVRDLDPGSHGFVRDGLTVTKFLQAKDNSLTLTAGAGTTRYWLRKLELRCTFAPTVALAQPGPGARRLGEGDYAVVVSEGTYADAAWRDVVEALVNKHQAATIIYQGAVRSALAELAGLFPRYACFVARPEELGRQFVLDASRMTRALDDDPYGDLLWGILTGYEAADALRIARQAEPLKIRRAAGGCGLDLNAFVEGVWYSEGEQGVMWEKSAGGAPQKKACPPDTTQLLVRELNEGKPQLFATSGHATSRDWQIGYTYKNGQFRCRNGRLFGLDTAGARFEVTSAEPKVYCPFGNCLMGLIEDRETMALAWMHSAGVCQMAGYVVSTWYGIGHAINQYLVNGQGAYNYAESFFLNGQYCLYELETRYPRAARLAFANYDIERDPSLLETFARENGLQERDELGLLWDRDTIAFYGDPAWDARVERVRPPSWEYALTEHEGTYSFEVTVPVSGDWSRPPAALLPHRVRNVQVTVGADLKPLITDNFILLPLTGKHEAGESYRVEFTAERVKPDR